MTDLVAHTRRLDGPIDLITAAGDAGMLLPGVTATGGLACRGAAIRLSAANAADAPAVASAALTAITSHDEVGLPGCGPVAVTAMPFGPNRPVELVVPALTVGRHGDDTWITTIAPAGRESEPEPFMAVGPRSISPDGFSLTSTVPHEKWCRLVEDALVEIDAGALTKVVLAREVVVEANRPIPILTVLERLRALYPSCYLFSVDGFIGASPELLIARVGTTVRSNPMAGTLAHSGDAQADNDAAAQLLGSVKDRWEHGLVVEAVASALRSHCSRLNVPEAPSIVSLRNVMHLGTEIEGEVAGGATALDLAAALHPTPAVGGTPTDAAVAWIEASEGIDRGRYAGPVGWVDTNGDGVFVVGIRSAEIEGATARLFAGVGVVAGSDPQDELAETQLKLQALLAAVVRP